MQFLVENLNYLYYAFMIVWLEIDVNFLKFENELELVEC